MSEPSPAESLAPPSTEDKAVPAEDRGTRRSKVSKKRLKMVKACERLLGEQVDRVHYPGGKSRDAVALELGDGRMVIAAVRGNNFRAALEHRILSELSSAGAPVPAVLGFDDQTLVLQERLEGARLSEELHAGSPEQVEQLLDSALTGLGQSQQAGTAAGLEAHLPALGVGKDWINDLLRRPLVIGGYLHERPARPKVDELRKLLKVRKPRFIKWDARPGNAIALPTQQVAWFDWEHSGTRNRMDDMAWLLCDEFTPDLPGVEARIIDRHIETFADDLSEDQARQYLYAYGIFHSVVRLGLILSRKEDEPWWDFDYCLERDKAGITLECASRLTTRAARWADYDAATRPLKAWFEAIGARLETL